MPSRLPPGPPLPRSVQTALLLRYWPRFVTACRRRYGKVFTLRILSLGTLVYLDDPADIKAVFDKCVEKIGFVPNVLRAYSLRPNKMRHFRAMSNELMLAPSGLSKLEREMVAVVVSCANHCYYCLVAHGQAVRQLSGPPNCTAQKAPSPRPAPPVG